MIVNGKQELVDVKLRKKAFFDAGEKMHLTVDRVKHLLVCRNERGETLEVELPYHAALLYPVGVVHKGQSVEMLSWPTRMQVGSRECGAQTVEPKVATVDRGLTCSSDHASSADSPVAIVVSGFDDSLGFTRYTIETRHRDGTTVIVEKRFSDWHKLHLELRPGLVFPEGKRFFHSQVVKAGRAHLLQQYLRDVLARGGLINKTTLFAFLAPAQKAKATVEEA